MSEQKKSLYRDDIVEINEMGIRLPNYYFPLGQSKMIPWSQLKGIRVEKMTFWKGKYRAWGMGIAPYWFNQGWRADKDQMIILDTGHFIKPVLTPDDPQKVLNLLEAKGFKI